MKATPSSGVDPLAILKQHYWPGSRLFGILVRHSQLVAAKAVKIASAWGADTHFVQEAAMLHDIGIIQTAASRLGCSGDAPYVCHGTIGADMLRHIGMLRHARVCETHVGAGISKDEIREQGLPLPERDMIPESIEEKIVCYADKFYSKTEGPRKPCKPIAQIVSGLQVHGQQQAERFLHWHALFGAVAEPE